MLEPPDIDAAALLAALRTAYGVAAAALTFLPLGADPHAAVYRLDAAECKAYFLKRHARPLNPATLAVPALLHASGVAAVAAPLRTLTGALTAAHADHTLVLYPFVVGQNGFAVELSETQWVAFGRAVRAMHACPIPPALRSVLPHWGYSPHWRTALRGYMTRPSDAAADPSATALRALLRDHAALIGRMLARAEQLELDVSARQLPEVLCHADLHGGNLLLGAHDALTIVDWDTCLLAPKERDLLFIGNGIGKGWNTPRESELFYQGYGAATVDQAALAYFRYERIIEDLAVYCAQLLDTADGGADRPAALRQVTVQFTPGDVISIALATDAAR